jgi:NACHT domain
MNLVSSADGLIAAYDASFRELRIEFVMGSTLQTALTTVRILEKVENIGTCFRFFTDDSLHPKCWWPSAHLIQLTRLPYIPNASWDPLRTCVPGTKVSLIDDIVHWLPGITATNHVCAERIYLLLGRPRCGKSAVSHTVAQRLHDEGRLGSAIFLARNVESRNSAQAIFSTMACDLAAFDDKIKEGISQAIGKNPSLPTAALERQFQGLIVGPTRELTIIGPVLLIIDGLDECQDIQERRRLLRILVRELDNLPTNFRILITARPEPDIEDAFRGHNGHRRREMDSEGENIQAVSTYIETTLSELGSTRPGVMGRYDIDTLRAQLQARSMELNLWASTACGFLKFATDGEVICLLDSLLSMHFPFNAEATMDDLYNAILHILFIGPDIDVRMGWQTLLRLETLPLSLRSRFLPSHSIDILVKIGCMVDKVDNEGFRTLSLQPAFEYFITDKRRCTDNRFHVDIMVAYVEICLDVVNGLLSRNICQLEDISLLNSELLELQLRVQQSVPESLQYACRYWAEHLLNISPEHAAKGTMVQLRYFLFKRLLHWIELSSLLGQLDAALASLKALEEWLKASLSILCVQCRLINALHLEIRHKLDRP